MNAIKTYTLDKMSLVMCNLDNCCNFIQYFIFQVEFAYMVDIDSLGFNVKVPFASPIL